MPRLINRQYILAETQSAAGSAATPDLNDAVLIENLSFSFVDEKIQARESLRPTTLGVLQSCNVTRRAQISFDTEIKGSGTNDVPPEISKLLVISGHLEAIIAAVMVTYVYSNNPVTLGTIVFEYDGSAITMIDCSATVDTSLKANMSGKDTWTVTGRIASIVDGSTAIVPNFDLVKPAQLNNMNTQLAGTLIAPFTELNWSLNNTISSEESLNGSDGFDFPWITARGPITGTINPLMEADSVGGIDWDTFWSANTVGAMTMSNIGTTSGNRISFSMPAVSVTSVQHAERNKLLGFDISLTFNETSAANDEILRAYS